ncbi:hypothetical protein [Actinomadura geliboluensis]|uniref:hypothetical protein n=1 Tax=Actinomadura geliboluensis TaxID=882440 RepID=UPI0036BCFA40
MAKLPPPPPAAEASAPTRGRLHDLREEFPGWTIETGQPSYSASRNSSAVPMTLAAGSFGEMRELLDEADAVDCGRAIEELAEALRVRGAAAKVHGLSLSTRTRAGILRVVAARRGRFTWSPGEDLGSITDVAAVADRMMFTLGFGARR